MNIAPAWWWGAAVAVPLLVAGLFAAVSAFGTRRWRAQTLLLHARLQAAQHAGAPTHFSLHELQGLPTPVQRYFRVALTPGQPLVRAVRVDQEGTLNTSDSGTQWRAFTARQQIQTQRPGFDWDARVEQWPGVAMFVRDAYVGGAGLLQVALMGAVTLARQQGGAEAARGELMRYLAESVWYPTALLPSQGVQWQAVDDTSARARLSDGDVTVELLFVFNAQGLVEQVRAASRGRQVGARVTLLPWRGRFNHPVRRDGMLVPLEGEVAWLMLGGQQPYWRGRITRLRYEWMGAGESGSAPTQR